MPEDATTGESPNPSGPTPAAGSGSPAPSAPRPAPPAPPRPGQAPAAQPPRPPAQGGPDPFARPAGTSAGFVRSPAAPARGLRCPAVPPAVAGAFGRPRGVDGPFGPSRPTFTPAPAGTQRPSPAYQQAFARPGGAPDLQRPPGAAPFGFEIRESPWWKPDAPRDPWRSAQSPVHLATPTSDVEPEEPGIVEADDKGRRRIRVKDLPLRLAGLFVIVAVILGVAGGATGYFLAKKTADAPLTKPDPTYSTVDDNRTSASLTDIAAKVQPSVVSIEVRVGQSGGTGSGVVIEGSGYVLTNNHVVSMAADPSSGAQIRAIFYDGTSSTAQIVGRDPKADLAVIKVDKPGLAVAQIGKSGTLKVGDQVVAFGSPLGLAGTVTSGIVSALNRSVHLTGEGSDSDAYVSALQTDASINPGNSGGALVDSNGAVIGINSAIASLATQAGGGGSIGLGFAIPSDYAMSIADQLIKTGKAAHGNLQLSARSVTDGTREGALVIRVDTGGAAASAGIQPKDVVIKAGDTIVGNSDDLQAAATQRKPGDKVVLTVIRDGSPTDIEVTLA